MIKKYETHGQDGCDDCQWMASETDGEILICPECDFDGQPDAAQEWADFDPDCQKGKIMFWHFLEIIRTVVPCAILIIQLAMLNGWTL